VLSVEASPALIALVACRGALGPVPDVVLSGVNHGPNTGHLVLHSGTVNAVLTAAYHGVPGLAVSMNSTAPRHWDTAIDAATQVLEWMLGTAVGPTVEVPTLSLNTPDVPVEQLRGVREARLAVFGSVQAEVSEVGPDFTTFSYRREESEPEEGTEPAWLQQGYASLTALRGPSELAMDFGRLVT